MSDEPLLRWPDLMAALHSLCRAPLTPDSESLLVDLLHFDGTPELDPDTEFPHSMSPYEILQSVAMQALARYTGPRYLAAFDHLRVSAHSPCLRSIAQSVINSLMRIP